MVAEQDVQIRSYLLWESAGRPAGQDLAFWLQAEADLVAEARYALKPWIKLAPPVVPRVLVCAPPQHIAATRIPARERNMAAASAAMR